MNDPLHKSVCTGRSCMPVHMQTSDSNMLAGVAAEIFRPENAGLLTGALEQARIEQSFARLSPNTLFAEATVGLLSPTTRALSPVMFFQLEGAVMGSPLPVMQSLLLVWPQMTGLIAATIILFAVGYASFQRQEVRA